MNKYDYIPFTFTTILGASTVLVKAIHNDRALCLASGEEMYARKIQILRFLKRVIDGDFTVSSEEAMYIIKTLDLGDYI